MLDFKKNRSKILAIVTFVISCASFALSAVAFNNSRKVLPPEPFKHSQEAPHGKHEGMKHPKGKHSHDHDHKEKPENSKENQEKSETEQKSDK